MIPKRFSERSLAYIGSETAIVGHHAVIHDDVYCVGNYNGLVVIEPDDITEATVGDMAYHLFTFEKGGVVITNTNIVQRDTLTYDIYDELIAKGKVPWYLGYEDMGKLFTTSKKHAGVTLSANNAPMEMIIAAITRTQEDRTKYLRHSLKTSNDINKIEPAFVPLRSPIYGATNTTAKMIGAYFDDSMTSALNNPSERTEGIERLLRS